MAWLWLPGLVVSSLGSNSSVPPIEPSVTWKGKPMQPRSWRLAWRRGVLTPLLSGLTSSLSMRARGVELWISSLRASRVSPSRSLANGSGKPTRDISGPTPRGSSRSATQLSFSWRTSTCRLSGNPGETFEDWASGLRRPLRARPPSWVRDILGDGSSFLPTARANKWGPADSHGKVPMGFLPTAVKADGERGLRAYKGGNPTLTGALLPTLTATDWKDSPGTKRRDRRRGDSRGLGRPLKQRFLPTPNTGQRGPREPDGKKGRELIEVVGGRVNPDWKDWFLGFPTGWTATERLATRSFQRWLRSHSRH